LGFGYHRINGGNEMKIKVEYTNEMIKQLIMNDINDKFVSFNKMPNVEIQVKSRQNYRQNEWEKGELKVEMEVEI
jgi:hypothetical protein